MDNRTIISCTNTNLLLLEKNSDGALCSVTVGRSDRTDTLISSASIGYEMVLPDLAAANYAVFWLEKYTTPLTISINAMRKDGLILGTYSVEKVDTISRLLQQAGHLRGLFALDVGVQGGLDFSYTIPLEFHSAWAEIMLREARMLISTAVAKEMANG